MKTRIYAAPAVKGLIQQQHSPLNLLAITMNVMTGGPGGEKPVHEFYQKCMLCISDSTQCSKIKNDSLHSIHSSDSRLKYQARIWEAWL